MDTEIDDYFHPDPAKEAEADARAEALWQYAKTLFAKIRADEMTAEECAKQLFIWGIESEEKRGVVRDTTPQQRLRTVVTYMSTHVDARKMQSLFKKAGFEVAE
jgi:hypothetical protein